MAIILILALGLFLRLINLSQSLWLDEAVQAVTSQGSFTGIFSELTGDFHPPLYHVLMWAWVHLFGSSEIILRLPSVVFGVATIYFVYLIGKQIFPKKLEISKIAALFLATAPFHIYYSQEARPYALVALLVSGSFYFFLKKQWFRYVLVTSLALYSSYYVFFVLVAQGLAMLMVERNKIAILLYCYIVILILFVPWLPMLLKQIQIGQQALVILPEWGNLVNANFIKALPITFVKFILGRITIFDKALYAAIGGLLSLLYGTVVITGVLSPRRSPVGHLRGVAKRLLGGVCVKGLTINNQQSTIAVWFFIPILFAWLVSLFTPNYQPFRLLFVLPAFYLLLALGVSNFSNKTVSILLGMIILLVNLASLYTYYSNPYFHREDWRGVVRFVESQDKAVAILPSATSNWPLKYYSTGDLNVVSIASGVRKVEQEDLDNLTMKQFNNIAIFYIRYLQSLFDPNEKIVSWLQNLGYVKIKEVSFNQIPVWEYALKK